MVTRDNTTYTKSQEPLSDLEIETEVVNMSQSGFLPIFHFKRFHEGKDHKPIKYDSEMSQFIDRPFIKYKQWDSNGTLNETKFNIIECIKMKNLQNHHELQIRKFMKYGLTLYCPDQLDQFEIVGTQESYQRNKK